MCVHMQNLWGSMPNYAGFSFVICVWSRYYYYSQFIDKETETETGYVTRSGTHSWSIGRATFEHRSYDFDPWASPQSSGHTKAPSSDNPWVRLSLFSPFYPSRPDVLLLASLAWSSLSSSNHKSCKPVCVHPGDSKVDWHTQALPASYLWTSMDSLIIF